MKVTIRKLVQLNPHVGDIYWPFHHGAITNDHLVYVVIDTSGKAGLHV